jgi:Protein of unknown function (DUF4238)
MFLDNKNQVSNRHHYVPEFYLKSWHDDDGKGLWRYIRNKVNKISLRRLPAKSICYEEHLYSLMPDTSWEVLNHKPDVVEKDFFQKVDDAAANVHQKLITRGLQDLADKDRSDWAIFLNSLIERSPKRIKEIRDQSSSNNLKQELIARWGKSDYFENINVEAMQKNAVITALPNFIIDTKFLEYIVNMRWSIVSLATKGEHFLATDTPLLINSGRLGNPIHSLSIALSPKKLLIIHKDCIEFDEHFLRVAAVTHNLFLVKQAQKYVVSSSMLKDEPHTKYLRAVESLLNNDETDHYFE